jgi:hypothetical protein
MNNNKNNLKFKDELKEINRKDLDQILFNTFYPYKGGYG